MILETHRWTPRVMEVKVIRVDIQNYQLNESKDQVLGQANHTMINPLNWYEKDVVIKVKD